MTADQTTVDTEAQKPRRRWVWPLATVLALFLGIGIGAASSGDTEPTEPTTITETETVEVPGEVPEEELAALEAREVELAEQEAALAEREAELDEREAAIAETEETIAANTVTDGIWTVGVDIEPGAYRATNVPADCYWAILVSGTSGSEIVTNGIPGGGNPTVTLEEGQDFESQQCGEWVKQ